MTLVHNRDYIRLIWKDVTDGRHFIVGELVKNGGFEFSYGFEVHEALQKGFQPLISFEDLSKTYHNDVLFPTFASRLPDPKRRDIDQILAKYELKEYDEYRLLKKSGAKLPIDNLQFIEPIFVRGITPYPIRRKVFLAGSRHYLECKGSCCKNSITLTPGEDLKLILEPENEFDSYAVQVTNISGQTVGYIPRYYSEDVSWLLNNGFDYKCNVIEFNQLMDCHNCLEVNLEFIKSEK